MEAIRKWCTYIFIVLLILPESSAQEEMVYSQSFSIEDGLSSTNPVCFFQDSRGEIWIGTSYGLNRYDGIDFQSYTKEDDGLCHNYIHRITEDSNGKLWIQGGAYDQSRYCFTILDPLENKVESIEDYIGQKPLFNEENSYLYSFYNGVILFGEDQGRDKIQFYEFDGSEIRKGFTLQYPNPYLHLATGLSNVYKIDQDTYTFAWPKESKEEGFRIGRYNLSSNGELHLLDTGDQALSNYFSIQTSGKHFYEMWGIVKEPYAIGKNWPSFLYKDGALIVSFDYIFGESMPVLLDDKIYVFHADHVDQYEPTSNDGVIKKSIPFKSEYPIGPIHFVDRSGNIWFYGTNSIEKVSYRKKHFKISLNTVVLNDINRPIRGISSTSDGTVVVGEFTNLNIRKANASKTEYEELSNKDISLRGGNLGLIHREDHLWIGKEFFGLCKLNIASGAYTCYGDGLIWQPYISEDGTIWAGAGKGLFRLDTIKGDLVPFKKDSNFKALYNSAVYAFHQNEKGTWLSTSSGVYLVDLSNENILACYNDMQEEQFYIPANHVAHLHEDNDGVFWLATKGQGLIKWDPTSGQYEQFTKKNTGLSHNVLYAVYEDEYGNLWLPSDYGLNCMSKNSKQISLYLEGDGLPHNEFNTISHHQDNDGKLYFGTINGMIEFHPKSFNHSDKIEPFIISEAQLIDRQSDNLTNITKYVIDHHEITIKPSDKALDIRFTLLDYTKADGNQYSYKLEGYKEEWIYQSEGFLRIGGLPYGNYQLHLRAKTSDSNRWVDYPKPIQIYIAKPIYLQWWFILLSILTLAASVYYIVKRNTRKLLERQEELESIVEERTEEIRLQAEELKQLDKVKSNFFANISHELRTPLTLILGPLSYILDNPEEWEKEGIKKQLLVMQRNGKSLMDLIEEILDLSKLEANKLELSEEATPVVSFFERLFFVFEPQFQSQQIDYELNLNVQEELNILLDRKKIEKVMNNFLSNAIKFTPQKGKIKLYVSETDDLLKIRVSDTGKGIHEKDLPHIFDRFYQSKQADQKLHGGTGIGLALVNEFAQLMKGKVYAESTLGVGSNFHFEIPKKVVERKSVLTGVAEFKNQEEEIYTIGNEFTVMVVEDNNDMRAFIHQLLEKKYKRVLTAKNGVEGLELLKKHGKDIHLIISDVMMPEMDGLTMLKNIKGHAEWFGIPVIMLTALAAERDKLTALTIGVDDYLTKPFSVPEVLIRVQNLLFNYHQRLSWIKSEEFQENGVSVIKTNTAEISINEKDKVWVDELRRHVEASIGETNLNVENMAAQVFLSARQLNRKLKSITGLSPAKFIKEVRLQSARKKLESRTAISVSEVALDVGFENISTFSAVFKQRFGRSPSTYLSA